MKIKEVNLETVCGITSVLPQNLNPEVAFAGRSNVGKSSLINTLMNRKAYARISSKPGKTQTINFYRINQECYLVDLPGYGYAKVGWQEKEQWGKLIERYLYGSKQLRGVFLLIDSRHAPTLQDSQMYEWIVSMGYTPILVLTKIDKLKRSQVAGQIAMIQKALHVSEEGVLIPFSAKTGQGKEELWAKIEELIR